MFKGIIISLFFILLLCFGVWFLNPILNSLPKPTEIYHVGTKSYELHNKKNNFTIRVWYPTDQIQQKQIQYANIKQNNLWIEEFAKRLHLPKIIFNNTFNFKMRSQLDVPLSSAHHTYPVIIFAPGSSVSYDYYESLLENLASHGYIIVGFNTIPMQPVVFPDGRVINDASRKPAPRINNLIDANYLSTNINLVIENFITTTHWLTKMNNDKKSIWYNHFNFHKLFIMGHSFGGYSMVVLAQQNLQKNLIIVGCINLDGWFNTQNIKPSRIPMLTLVSDTPNPVFNRKLAIQQMQQMCKISNQYCSINVISGAGHMSFTDFAFTKWQWLMFGTNYIPGVPALFGTQNPYLAFQNINNEILNFLKKK